MSQPSGTAVMSVCNHLNDDRGLRIALHISEHRWQRKEHTAQRTWHRQRRDHSNIINGDRTTEREEAGDMSIKISLMDQSWRLPRANQPRTSSAPISKRSETHPLVSLFAFTSIARLAYHHAACVCLGPFCQLLRKSVLWPPSFGCCFPDQPAISLRCPIMSLSYTTTCPLSYSHFLCVKLC